MAQRANQIFTSLSQAQQAAARRLFVSLVTPGEGREDTRARAVYPEQDDAIAAVIDKFSAPTPASWSPARTPPPPGAWSISVTRQ